MGSRNRWGSAQITLDGRNRGPDRSAASQASAAADGASKFEQVTNTFFVTGKRSWTSLVWSTNVGELLSRKPLEKADHGKAARSHRAEPCKGSQWAGHSPSKTSVRTLHSK